MKKRDYGSYLEDIIEHMNYAEEFISRGQGVEKTASFRLVSRTASQGRHCQPLPRICNPEETTPKEGDFPPRPSQSYKLNPDPPLYLISL